MNNPVSVEVLERLTNMKRYQASHVCRNRLKLACGQILLQVTPCHVFHHDAVLVLTLELLFEPYDIWAVFTL